MARPFNIYSNSVTRITLQISVIHL
uniref:Uncharacterized protein n=1 Tax=Anguilla anguilla TaxID=7936 RepID=A0A0E9QM72_ANGAN